MRLELAVAFDRGDRRPCRSVAVFPGVNVSDREVKWTKNYRCPDVAVFLPGNPAKDRGTHWFGGPDFAVEVISPTTGPGKKFAFYAKVGVRELLLVDRKPWALELYRLQDGVLKLVGKSIPETSAILDQHSPARVLPPPPRHPAPADRSDPDRRHADSG